MIRGVDGQQAFHSLQELQRSRSFQAAERSPSIFRQALEQELIEAPHHQETLVESAPQHRPPAFEAPVKPLETKPVQPIYTANLTQLVHEVKEIAESSGYVGISPEDVVRAYNTGQSFLADYKV